ncbi:MAG: hypothetical protein KAR20_01400 [Candidatus Heimdallarchaeota archaeon]|nr:hypothetical protein [Candidatus Heimdallarchaeota archaeon]
MGRDLLAQDYMLKQLTASLLYPEDQLGSDFWNRVYKRAYEEYGTTEVPMNTFNKVWIVPEKAVIYENGLNIFVVESRLKVMLEEDYLALEANAGSIKHGLGNVSASDLTEISEVSSKVIKEIIIPEIEREVNEGKTFANLRQISNSVILATWYKQNIQQGILNRIYVNRNKTGGIDTEDKEINQKIYNQYVEAFEKGVYNFIKEDYDLATQEIIPRKYFSGGVNLDNAKLVEGRVPEAEFLYGAQDFRVRLSSSPIDAVKLLGEQDDELEKLRLQAYGPGGTNGLIDLEKSYNESRTFMSFVFGLTGAILGGLPAFLITQDPYWTAGGSLVGSGAIIATYKSLFPKSKYKNMESGIRELEKAATEEELQSARGLFVDAMAESDLVTLHRLGITGLEASDKLLAKANSLELTELVLPQGVRPLNAEDIRRIETNLSNIGLGGLLQAVIHDNFPYLSVTPRIPTSAERQALSPIIKSSDMIDSIFEGLALDSNTILSYRERIWHGLFDLLYRQDGDTSFTPEYLELYRDNEIFTEQGVLQALADDQKRSQEDYLVEEVKSRIDPERKYRVLVFATGSGALVNNLLQQIPNIEVVVEYDRSQTSNQTADRKRKEILPSDLYGKVRQITADVRNFRSNLNGEEFDFIISTASLRLMDVEARNSVVDFLKSKVGLKKGGAFIYMDTKEHREVVEQASQQLQESGFEVSVNTSAFPGHRDAMFYIFVHQYRRNPAFKQHVDQLMQERDHDNLYQFLYEMAGHRKIGFQLFTATQTEESLRKRTFRKLVSEFSNLVNALFAETFDKSKVTVEQGPSSRVTIQLLGGNPEVDYLDSFDIFVDTQNGRVAQATIYDGRSIGKNTLVLGRIVLQDPLQDKVILTQHVLTSRYGYDEILEQLKSVFTKILPERSFNVENQTDMDLLAQASVGLSERQIRDIVSGMSETDEEYRQKLIDSLSSHLREVYPSQEQPSFSGAGKIFLEMAKESLRLAEEAEYDSISGLVSLPDGLQNLVLYQRYGYRPIIPKNMEKQFIQVQTVLGDKSTGSSLREKSWYLSRRMNQQLFLIQKDIASSPIRENDGVGGIDFNPNIMEIESSGRNEEFIFEFDNQRNVTTDINGLVPIIINVTPVTNIPLLLGESENKPEAILSQL